jgi:hypothetical protein
MSHVRTRREARSDAVPGRASTLIQSVTGRLQANLTADLRVLPSVVRTEQARRGVLATLLPSMRRH